MMRVNISCYYAVKRKGGEKVLVTAMNRKECSSAVDYIRLNEPVTDPKDLAKAKKDADQAQKIIAKQEAHPDGKRRRRTGQAVMVDPGLADPVAPETPKAPPPKKAAKKKLTPTQEKARTEARKKAAAKKKAAREQSAKDEAAAKAAE